VGERSGLLKLLKIDQLFDSLAGYIESKIIMLKLEIKEELAATLGKLAVYLIAGFLFMLFLFFVSFAMAVWLNQVTKSVYLGYLSVAGFYLILMILVILFRKYLKIKELIEEKLVESIKKNLNKNE
jgi:hypothetical protein